MTLILNLRCPVLTFQDQEVCGYGLEISEPRPVYNL